MLFNSFKSKMCCFFRYFSIQLLFEENLCYVLFFLDLFFIFYVVCLFGGCLNDMQIIINNFVYDNILNIINIEVGFYLLMNSKNEQLEYNVFVWMYRMIDNFINYYYYFNVFGFIFLFNFGMLYFLFYF